MTALEVAEQQQTKPPRDFVRQAIEAYRDELAVMAIGVKRSYGIDTIAVRRLPTLAVSGPELARLYILRDVWRKKLGELNKQNLKAEEIYAKEWRGYSSVFTDKVTGSELPVFDGIPDDALDEATDIIMQTRQDLVDEVQPEPELPTNDDENEEEPGEPEPFQCIGYNQAGYWFLLGKQRSPFLIGRGAFNGSKLGELAPLEWWSARGAIGDEGAIKVSAGQEIVIRLQNEYGFFDSDVLRGPGVWVENKEVVINTGTDIVTTSGKSTPIEQYRGRFAYTRSDMRFGSMSGDVATKEEGGRLTELFKAQGFLSTSQSIAALGWSLIAPFGGVLSWRPHIWVTGKTGSGKSFLLEAIIARLCGDYVYTGSGRSTEPGVRRSINMTPCPVILDEMTPKNKDNRSNIVKLIELARNSCGDSAGRSTFAAGSDGTVSYLTRSPFCLGSVNIPDEGEEIANRFIRCELRAPVGPAAKDEKIKESRRLYAESMADPARFRRRTFRALPRILRDIDTLRSFLPREVGDQRLADVWAPILAAAWSAVSDESVETGADWLGQVMTEAMTAGTGVASDEDRVVEHILDAVIEADDRRRRTVAEWLTQADMAPADPGYAEAEKLLARYGIRIIVSKNRRCLAIATASDYLTRIFAGTIYEAGYGDQIKRNPLCINPEKPAREKFASSVKAAWLLDWGQFRETYMEERKEVVK